MFKNYLLDSLRNIKKYKIYSFINLFGLSIGIMCFIFMFLWIQDELNFDRFHVNADEIYRVIVKKELVGGAISTVGTPNLVGPTLKNEFPEVINFTRIWASEYWIIQYGEKKFYNTDICAYGDPAFFDIFSYSFLKGNPKTALNDPGSVVITENFAKKYFGNEDPMNKIIKFTYDDFKVTGVIKKVPENSHLQFDCILPIINTERFFHRDLRSWRGVNNFYTYIQVRKGTSWKELEKKISNIVRKYDPESKIDIYLQPLKDIHLKSNFSGDRHNYNQGSIIYVYLLSLLALSILFIACFNYTNLFTARVSERSKGIALRKVVGANQMDIAKQFLSEAIVLSFIALIFALILVYFFLPAFNVLSSKHLTFEIFGEIPSILGLIILTVLVGFIAGSYPAFLLASSQPVNILKDSKSSPKNRGAYLRKTLVVLQFTVAIFLIIAIIIIYWQLNFIKTKDLGFNPHNVISFLSVHQMENSFEEKKALFMSNPNVLGICWGNAPIFLYQDETDNVDWEGKSSEEKITVYLSAISYGFIELYEMKLVEGRSFSKEFSTDASAFILNETAVKTMNLKSPVGKRLRINNQEGTIIGVLKDFHHRSLHEKIMPIVLSPNYQGGKLNARINSTNVTETMLFLENTWNKMNKTPYPFSGFFIDENIDKLYKNEQKMGTIAQLSSFITLLISCLGLFGLASYTSKQKTKEIGIRKVLGASVSSIIWLISKEFLKWVIIALIIACPLAWYIMNRWLQNFAYRISIEWWMFVFTGAIALAIAFLTVSYQVIKAAKTNPVNTLRYE